MREHVSTHVNAGNADRGHGGPRRETWAFINASERWWDSHAPEHISLIFAAIWILCHCSFIFTAAHSKQEGMKRSNEPRPFSRVRVVWDEENLHQLEACKSPKQKITEPKTPYYAPDAGDGGFSPTPSEGKSQMDSASHAEAVRHALFEVATEDIASSSRSSGSGWTEDEAEDMDRSDEGVEENHSGSFEEHRRKHYDNEYRKAKLLADQSELANEDEDAGNGEAEPTSPSLKQAQQQ